MVFKNDKRVNVISNNLSKLCKFLVFMNSLLFCEQINTTFLLTAVCFFLGSKSKFMLRLSGCNHVHSDRGSVYDLQILKYFYTKLQ